MTYYKYRQEQVKVKGMVHPAFFPRYHSTLRALVYHTENIPTKDWSVVETYTWCYAKYKDNPRWKTIYEGPRKDIKIPNLEPGWHDIHKVLFAFEVEEIRKTPTTRTLTHRDLVSRL